MKDMYIIENFISKENTEFYLMNFIPLNEVVLYGFYHEQKDLKLNNNCIGMWKIKNKKS